jgi:hypothetical protein
MVYTPPPLPTRDQHAPIIFLFKYLKVNMKIPKRPS